MAARGADRARDTEVGHPGVIAGQEDVFGLDVAMDDAVSVRVGQCVTDLEGDAQRRLEWQAVLPPQAGPQRLAPDVTAPAGAQSLRPNRHGKAIRRRGERDEFRGGEPGSW